MMQLLHEIRTRNELLFFFGLFCYALAVGLGLISLFSGTRVNDVNAWHKPIKFALSIGIYCHTMVWLCSYLPRFNFNVFAITTVVLLGFEIVYITLQAARGQQSHFNTTTPFYNAMYAAMGMAATVVTLYTAYIGILFLVTDISNLPPHYLHAIRWGIFIFVIFSFEGYLMGARMAHTVGGPDGPGNIPLLNWSAKYGDLRVAHFIGMHALQVLPLVTYYLIKNKTGVTIMAIFYLLLASYTLVRALSGKPIVAY